MEIGIGLPNQVPGASGVAVVEWARRAEERGFHGLATIDRLAYPTLDSLATLAAAAGATSRIKLLTNILLAPLYPPALLAKSAASIDQLSGGRFTLGLAPGSRQDDYTQAGADFHRRGRDFDTLLTRVHRAWAGEGPVVGPTPVHGRVPVVIGGYGDAAVRRTLRWGAGATVGGGSPDQAREYFRRIRTAWREDGRPGEPRLIALAYFSAGADAEEASVRYLADYYRHLGPVADRIAGMAARSPGVIKETIAAFADAGATELYFDGTVADVDQVDRLADIVF